MYAELSHSLVSICMFSVQVTDSPRFGWRGVLLDVGRHYFSVPFHKKFLDAMAFHKMNKFHWHLTEDQVGLETKLLWQHALQCCLTFSETAVIAWGTCVRQTTQSVMSALSMCRAGG